MRYKIKSQTLVSNVLSHLYQAILFIYSDFKCGLLYFILVVGEKLYIFGYSHYNAYRNRIEDTREHTYYMKDGYGRRYKIFRHPSSFFDPINYRPSLPFRHRKRSDLRHTILLSQSTWAGHTAAQPP